MTEFNSKYANAQIYWIHCRDAKINQFYVGSTCNFYNRREKHIRSCCNPKDNAYNSPVYIYIRENGGWNNFIMDTIEPFPCNNKLALLINEQEWINILEPTLNKNKAYQTKEELKEYQNQYRTANKDYFNQYRTDNKEYFNQSNNNRPKGKFNCTNCDKTYTYANKQTHLKSKYCKNYKSNEKHDRKHRQPNAR
jgi:hypothetical protein